MSTPEEFRELLYWSDEYWPSYLTNPCDCGHEGEGPRHHDARCPFVGWAWEMKARDLLRGNEPGQDPAKHLQGAPARRPLRRSADV